MRVVNARKYKGVDGLVDGLDEAFGDNWVYIGRPNGRYGLSGSSLANPFGFMDSRSKSLIKVDDPISNYREFLRTKLDDPNSPQTAAMFSLTSDAILVCWCSPAPCHGDVVVELWDSLIRPRLPV